MIDVYIVVGNTGVPGYKSIFFICKSAHGKWMDFLMIPCLWRLQLNMINGINTYLIPD